MPVKLDGAIETLIGTVIEAPEALIAEAKERIRDYFQATDDERWAMCSPTYRQKYSEAKFKEACNEWFPLVDSATVSKVELTSGCSAKVEVEVTLAGNYHITKWISLIKEAGPYQPDPSLPFSIVGHTAPPYSLSVAE